MIKAIIVEDERLIREGITSQVPWDELHINEVRSARNAENALNICKEYHPDIIISDIRMPGMNGIELCKQIHFLLPEAQIIFISGYSDKEYLMSAINLHAINYIEKPISLEKLILAIQNATHVLQKNRSEKNNIFHTLLNSQNLEENIIPIQFKKNRNEKKFFLTVVFNLKTANINSQIQEINDKISGKMSDKNIQYMTDFTEKRKLAFLFFSVNEQDIDILYADLPFWKYLAKEQEIPVLMKQPPENSLFAGIGIKVNSINNIRTSYESACTALNCLSYKGWNHYAYNTEVYTEWNTEIDNTLFIKFKKAIAEKHEYNAVQILLSIYKQLVNSKTVLTYTVRNIYYTLDDAIVKSYQQLYFDSNSLLETNEKIKEHSETIQELHAYLCYRVHSAISCENKQKNSFVIKHITTYVQNHYNDKQLSIQSIADKVFLTPTYISCLYKKKTGQTISQYIQDYRLQKAEEFLKNPEYKIYQISGMVGYEDAHYFARIFKKQTGLKPSDFRDLAE